MTGNTSSETMRHIPEDELHAYLDQALSRPQCVEIESHLAFCPGCRVERDSIAALRDRTTALLAELAPPRRVLPAFEVIRQRHAAHTSARRHRARTVAWVASVVAAVGLGWTASRVMPPDAPQPAPAPRTGAPLAATAAPESAPAAIDSAPTVAVAEPDTDPVAPATTDDPARQTAPQQHPASAPVGDTASPAAPADTSVSTPEAPGPRLRTLTFELATLGTPDRGAGFELDGVWRTVSWAGAKEEAGGALPHLDGLPVVEVQVQGSRDRDARPVMMVAQQLASGEVIRTIEGPVADISQLLARRTPTDPEPGALITDTANGQGSARTTMAMQRGDRMLAITGSLPADSLRAMIRRMNAEMRAK